MWVHESFTTYSEALFVESQFGKQAGQEYIHGQRRNISNDSPIIGPYGVNKEGSGDMYDKGSMMLNTIRTVLNDDAKWRQLLRGLSAKFYHQTVTGQQVIDYFNQESGHDLTKIFDQYLHHASIPTLEIRFEDGKTLARWVSEVEKFDMPVRVRVKGGEYQVITPTARFAPVPALAGATRETLEVDTFNYYIGVLMD